MAESPPVLYLMAMLRTQRLLLRRWRPAEDLPRFAEICADPEVMRWIADGSVRTREECALAIRAYEEHWEEHGFGLYATTLRGSGELIGSIGLSIPTFLPEILPAVEIGWRLRRDCWGRGLATEAARSVMDFGFQELRLDEIVSIHQVGNDASERVMERLGMRLLRRTVHPRWGRPLHVHTIRRQGGVARSGIAPPRPGS